MWGGGIERQGGWVGGRKGVGGVREGRQEGSAVSERCALEGRVKRFLVTEGGGDSRPLVEY